MVIIHNTPFYTKNGSTYWQIFTSFHVIVIRDLVSLLFMSKKSYSLQCKSCMIYFLDNN